MNKILIRISKLLLFTIMIFAGLKYFENQTAIAEGKKLSSDAEKVIEYLLADWRKQFRSTDIAAAIENLGLKQDDELRLEIGNHFRENKRLASNLRFWGPNNYILSHTEKLITKYLIHKIEREGKYPTIAETVKALEIDEKTLKERFAFMKKAGILVSAKNSIKYSLVFDYKTWGGPLRYNSHIVTVAGEQPFGVWWAVDFLLLVNSTYANKKIHIEDSCSHCYLKIDVEVDNASITKLSPGTTWIQQGGGWAVDNLFWSEEHVEEFLNENPEYRDLDQMPIVDFLNKVIR